MFCNLFPSFFFCLIVSNYVFNMSFIKNAYILQMGKYNFHIYICHDLTPAGSEEPHSHSLTPSSRRKGERIGEKKKTKVKLVG